MHCYLGAVLRNVAFFCFLVSSVNAGGLANSNQRSEVRARSYTPVLGVQTTDDDPGSDTSLPTSRTVNFDAEGLQFKLYLNIHRVLADDAEILHYETEEPTRTPVVHRSYKGAGEVYRKQDDGTYTFVDDVRASVTFHEEDADDVFHAVIRSGNEQWTIDPIRAVDTDHLAETERRRLQMFEGSDLTSMWMWSSLDEIELKQNSEGVEEWVSAAHSSRRKLLAIIPWNNCYPGQKQAIMQLSTGWLVDNGYANRVGGAAGVRDNVAQMVSDSNVMYLGHMNIEWRIDTVLSGNNVPGFNFNEAPTTPGQKTCPSRMGASQRLNSFRAWRTQNYPNTIGAFHLMTDCHPPSGTIGIAYVGALCSVYGVGLTSWTGSTTWETVAHELGHNFGSGHTFDVVNTRGVNGGIMDYGDGVYEGEHQFHTVHKDEVCAHVRQSMAQNGGIENCWSAKVDATPTPPSPTPNPVPAPTNAPPNPVATPTQKPVAPPTRPPVPAPTNSTPSGAATFRWSTPGETGLGECNPACAVDYDGDGDTRNYQTVAVHCLNEQTDAEVEDFWCLGATSPSSDLAKAPFLRPNYGLQACNVAKCPDPATSTTACGDGHWSPLEVCDPSAIADPVAKAVAQGCCTNTCSTWADTEECLAANPTVDAAFQASDGKVWVFQGNEMAIFEKISDISDINGTPIDGYPRAISGTIPFLDASFVDGIDAAVSREDGTAYLIKGMNYVLIDLEDGQTAQGVQPLSSLKDMGNIAGCAKIDSAISYKEHMFLVCGSVVSIYEHGVGSVDNNVWRTVDSIYQDLTFPGAVDDHALSAAIRDRVSGKVTFFKANMHASWFSAETVSAAQTTPGLGASKTDGDNCVVDNCETCNNAEGVCAVCKAGHKLKRGGRKCKYRKNLLLDLDFDSGTGLDLEICELLLGPERCSPDDVGTTEDFWSVRTSSMQKTDNGQFGAAAVLTGTERVPLTRQCQLTQNWQVSFWWMPEQDDINNTEIKPTKFLTMMRDRGKGYMEQYSIWMDAHANYEESVFGQTLVLHVSMYGDNHECYVHTPITYNEWNKITIKFEDGVMHTMANGNKHQIAFSDTAGEADIGVDFCDWWLGDDLNGIKGKIDNLEVRSLDRQASEEDDDSDGAATWVAPLVGTLCGVAFCCLLVFGYRYVKSKELLCFAESDDPGSRYGEARDSETYSPKAINFVNTSSAPSRPTNSSGSNASFKTKGLGTVAEGDRRDSWQV